MRKAYRNGRGRDGSRLELLVEAGRFLEVGPRVGEANAEEDLGGLLVLPAFVDSHCHILPMGLDMLKLDLSGLTTPEEVLEAVRDRARGLGPGDWLLAVQYDQNRFATGEHLTRADLDSVLPDRPALLRHANGHASVANSAALQAAGVTDQTPDPEGGEYRRGADGRPDGVLLEKAHEHVTAAAPKPTSAEMAEGILRAGESMARLGITAASDMLTGRWDLAQEVAAYRAAAERGCKVRLRLSLIWSQVFGPRGIGLARALERLDGADPGDCRAFSIKIFADGAIASATAAIHGRFLTTGGDGQLIYAPERLTDMVRTAHDAGQQVCVHAIGDRAVDHVLAAFEATGEPSRHRLEHAMVLSDSQIDRIQRAGCPVTMQPEFLIRFGAAYFRQLPPDAAGRLKRAKSLLDAGVPLSFSSDRPIVPGDPWDGVRTAARRPDGFDQEENVPIETAFDLYTRAGADANGDPHQGRIEPGARADFQVARTFGERAERVFKGGERTA
jgi:predicted amidohydrolase YtcJ